ncbi:MAG: hypothetical protein PUC11_04060 [Elusimicrobia bacterium]|nr:hypothetical protein [Elusimicrobiota bacterium]
MLRGKLGQVTTLDVLIVMALPDFFHEVDLDKDFFACHSCYVKNSSAFTIATSERTVSVRLSSFTSFRSVYRQLMNWYEKDVLLPFDECGFGALRLAAKTERLMTIFFSKQRVYWNLENDSCYVGERRLPGSGLEWALDIFAISRICASEFGRKTVLQVYFSNGGQEILWVGGLPASPEIKNCFCCALGKRAEWGVRFGPLVMVDKSTWAKFGNFPINLHRINGKAQRLLWICLHDFKKDKAGNPKPISLAQAYRAVNGRKKYRPKYDLTNKNYDPAKSLDKSIQKKIIANARDVIVKAIKSVIKKHHLKSSFEMPVTNKGVWIDIIEN